METNARIQASNKVTLVGAVNNVFLAAIKISVGITGHSAALVADGFHSLADLLTDVLVIFAARYGGQDADADHPYGHGRIETVATVFIAILLVLTGLGIIYDVGMNVLNKNLQVPSVYVLAVAALSIATKESLYRYTIHTANKIQSDLLRANAWHHRSDAFTSIVVLFGVAGVLMGFPYFDAIAAAIVAVMIANMGWDLGWNSLRELIDTGVDEAKVKKIRNTILSIPGVIAVHQLRTRSMSGSVLVDVHVIVNSHLSVSEGHHISEQVYVALNKNVDEITDVTVHIDPEDDEVATPCIDLPAREDFLPQLQAKWADLPLASKITRVIIHYLNGQLHLECHIPFRCDINAEQLETFKNSLKAISQAEQPDIKSVKVMLVY